MENTDNNKLIKFEEKLLCCLYLRCCTTAIQNKGSQRVPGLFLSLLISVSELII